MTNNPHEWELAPFVQQAMSIAHNREQPISVQKQNFENLLSAVYEYTRQKVEAQIKSQRTEIQRYNENI
jgi:hypothetical protein